MSEAGPVGLQITHFDAGGAAAVYTFDASSAGGARALAVGGAGTVYVSDATNPFVDRFTRFDGPTVTTDPATSIDPRDATLNGTINPEGVSSNYHFEYGLDFTYGSSTPVTDAGNGSIPVAKTATISGLAPNTIYHYRIVGSNSSGSIAGPDQTLPTAATPAVLSGPFTSEITPRSASIHGTINPNNNFIVRYHVEYGTTMSYGTSTPAFPRFLLGAGGSDISVDAVPLSGLEPDTLYHFRFVADNDGLGGTQQGADQTFITTPAAGGGATGVSTRRATLTGTINAHGAATTYHFNYGPTAAYGAVTPEVDGGDTDGDRVVSQQVSGLSPDTTYHVQVVATTGDVVRTGADGLFRTAPAPTAVAIGPTIVTTSAATLAGDVNTYGLTGSYRFDVSSLDSPYAISTAERPVAGSASTERVTVPLTGLPAGETFVVQLTVTSNDSSTVSDLVTFATAAVPKVFPPPPGSDTTSTYGCGAPHLDAYNTHPRPGDTIEITGNDLGIGANVTLDDRSLRVSDWSSTGFGLTVPDDAKGTLALTIDCGHRSNTIAIAVFQEPDNAFSISDRSVTGSTAMLTVRVSGPGKVETQATNATAAKVTIKKARTATIKVRLTPTGQRALNRARSRTLKVSARVRYTPAGGKPKSKTVTLTFKRTARR